MSIENILNTVKNIKNDIRDAIQEKGVVVAPTAPFDTYDNYIRTINSCEPSQPNVEEWQPDPKWFNIDAILAEDTNAGTDYDYLDDESLYGKMIVLLGVWDSPDSRNWDTINVNLDTPTGITVNYFNAVKFSDGAMYVNTKKSTITHTFDTTFDKPTSIEGIKTRYAIFYHYKRDYSGYYWDMYNRNDYAFSIIIKDIKFGTDNWLSNLSNPAYLKSFKLLGDSVIGQKYKANNGEALFSTNNVIERYYFENSSYKLNWANLDRLVDCLHFIWPKKPLSGDITTGYVYGSNSYKFYTCHVIDITNCDFEHCHYNIFSDTIAAGKTLKGVIDLSHNEINANKTYYIFNSAGYTDFGNKVPTTVSIILPSNANVQIRVAWMSDESLKYLVDNAPELTLQKTLTLSTYVYNQLLKMSPGFEGVYKGKEYSDGIQLLKAKGWTVAHTTST
jgi:hypothetical protein